ncbi:MAG TPA: site-specific integrase [Polyangia bacterium]
MGHIRDRLIEEMELRGLSTATKKMYVMCCRQFTAHFMKSPEQLGAVETKAFILHLIRERKASPSAIGVYVAALRFLYRVVLRNQDAVDDLPRPKVPKRLPTVPSKEEVDLILSTVRVLKYRTILTIAYGAGLRISEACRLRAADVDSTRMVLHIKQSKRGKDRLVPLSPRMLDALRRYWVAARPTASCLFPGRRPDVPITKDAVRKVFKSAVAETSLKKRFTLHSLRHGFATHLLDDGEDVRVLQVVLGHSDVQTTAHYARVTTRRLRQVKSPVDQLKGLQNALAK